MVSYYTDEGVLNSPMGFFSMWIGSMLGLPTWAIALSFAVECFILFAAGLFFADLVSGIVHLTLDYEVGTNDDLRCHAEYTIKDVLRFEAEDDLFKKAKPRDQFLWNFHAHHDAPYPASDSNFELVMQIVRPVSLPVIGFCLIAAFGLLPMWFMTIVLAGMTIGPFMQFTHFLSHARGRNLVSSPVIRFMQDHRIILHPADHKSHHVHFDRDFCIMNGWANFIINPLRRFLSCVGVYPKEAPTVITRREREERKGDLQRMEMNTAPASEPPKEDGL